MIAESSIDRRTDQADRTRAAFRRFIPPATVARVTRQHQVDDSLPPLPSPDATDAELVARIGAPSLEDYRRACAGCGAPWPGDDGIRRRHPVAADPAA